MAGPDKATKKSIALQEQAMANQTALADATRKSLEHQGRLELEKSMSEMNAKGTKDAGTKLSGLA